MDQDQAVDQVELQPSTFNVNVKDFFEIISSVFPFFFEFIDVFNDYVHANNDLLYEIN